MLKAAEISPTLSLYHSAGFSFNNHYSKHWGNTTFNHTPVVSQCILIAADQNSTAFTCQQNRHTWGQDNCILCVVCKKKAKTSKPHPPSLPSKSGEKFTWVLCWYTARSHTLTRTEGRAKRLYASQSPETASWRMKWSLCKGKFFKNQHAPCKYL